MGVVKSKNLGAAPAIGTISYIKRIILFCLTECGKIRARKHRTRTRIVGGTVSTPGDWPFIAAILGGPEEIFYCAGVLISDQFVLTASHCVGK